MSEILRRAWARWQIIGHINGDYVARVLVNGFYFTILVPFALIVKLFSDPLRLKQQAKPHWLARKPVASKLEDARGQF